MKIDMRKSKYKEGIMNSNITVFMGDKNTFEIVDNEKPGYIYYNKDINKFRGFLKDEANEDEKFLWRTIEMEVKKDL